MDNPLLQETLHKIKILRKTIQERIVWNKEVIRLILITFLAWGHSLIEWKPWIAKTTLINTFAKLFNLDFKRIQFTPDLLPTDILGMTIFNPENRDFEFKEWPLFSNIILADEINRAPAKVQSALLEAMAEKQITISNTSYPLGDNFCVFATQNNIDNEGTYALPEAQLDRFMFKIIMDYPSKEEELEILKLMWNNDFDFLKIKIDLDSDTLIKVKNAIQKEIIISDEILNIIANIVSSTRNYEKIENGASPRASIAFLEASKVSAFLDWREYVTISDIIDLALPILRHRIILTWYQDEEKTKNIIINKIINQYALKKISS